MSDKSVSMAYETL